MTKNALLLSVRPKYAQLIFEGSKTVELRRVKPRLKSGELVFLYESSPTKALRGAFEVDEIIGGTPIEVWKLIGTVAGISRAEYDDYFRGSKSAFAIKIKRTWNLDAPVQLARLRKQKGGFRAPQSFHYVCKHRFAEIAGLTRELQPLLKANKI